MNICMLLAVNCKATPASMISDPRNRAALRPSMSEANGVRGSPCTFSILVLYIKHYGERTTSPPILWAEFIKPVTIKGETGQL